MTTPTFTQTDTPGAPYSRTPGDVTTLTRVRGGLPTTPSLTRNGNAFTPVDVSSITWRLGYDAASQAIFNALTTPPSADRRAAIDNLVSATKSAGIWDELDLLYVLAASDSQASLINWKNPGIKTLSAVNSPSFQADRGWTGNGSSSRLNTNWAESVDAVKYSLNSASIWLWSRTESQRDTVDIGHVVTPGLYIFPRTSANKATALVNSTSVTNSTGAQPTSVGFFGAQRRGATDQRIFFNGGEVGASASPSTSLSSSVNWLLGGSATHFSNRQQSIAAWGSSLAGKELAFYQAVRAYLQAVGAA